MARVSVGILVVAAIVWGCVNDSGEGLGSMGPAGSDPVATYGRMPHPNAEGLSLEEEFELYRIAIEAALQSPAEYGLSNIGRDAILNAFPQLGSRPSPHTEHLTDAEVYWLNREAYVSAAKLNRTHLSRRDASVVLADVGPSCGEAQCKTMSANVKKCRNKCISWWQISLSIDASYDMCIRTDGYPISCPN